ncbi:MAG: hypothetical protein NTU80_14320 [Verrucomicrobia bacterium]|nr:hypothetical protein [Verrucomicrobiota bacterium]
MFLSTKTKGYVYEQGEQITVLARVSSQKTPLVIEDIREFPTGDPAALSQAIGEIRPPKSSGYLFAKCGVSPEQRFIRRAGLDPKRIKEEKYLAEIASSQFRVDPDQSIIAVLNASDGLDFDPSKAGTNKEVIFCGMPNSVAETAQEALLKSEIYPDCMELSSLCSIAALIDYLKFNGSGKPTLVLELGAQSTQSYIVSTKGLEATRPIAVGLETMVPVVQKELGLKDEESARKLFFSNTFDFTGMGAALCKRLLKELQSSMGFYEVQTGQSIGQLVCTVLPEKLSWLEAVIGAQLGVAVLTPEFKPWLDARQVTVSGDLNLAKFDSRKFALVGLILDSNPKPSDASTA